MARPRKPTALLELNGAFKKNPARALSRSNEPRPEDPLGPPPAEWVERSQHSQKHIEMLRIWDELTAQAAFGVLTSADRFHVEATVRLMYKIRFEKPTSGDYSQLNKCLGQMGLNPADRSRVSSAKKQEDTASEWARVAESRRAHA